MVKICWARRVLALFISSALLTLAACGGGTSGKGAGDGRAKVRIAVTGADSLPFMAVLQLAIDKGWFKKEGLDVSLFSGGGGGNTLRVVTSGDADLAISGSSSVVLAAEKPAANLKIVGSWFQVNDFYWISANRNAGLKNASLGFSSAGSATELVLKALQKRRPGENIKSVAVGGMGDNWAAARAGKITGGWAMHPFVTQKQQDGARVLVASRDVIGDHPADLVAVNRDFASDNAPALKAFFRAAQKALTYVAQQPDTAAKDLAPLIKVDAKTVAKALKETPELRRAYSLKPDPKALRNLSDLMEQAGEISQPVDWAHVLDQQYLPHNARAAF
ncbi:ABC transporter substrate-binding protein [Streptomyces sp. 110]|uniref:ABC transporter substrate-binding protein n=1 Tax=Streptomyces endocoffeicus TaxID=2898945 RepID=A0ABS1PVH9_9ACTN|nr:ABC transporter substrate-binding protein [Streptomyces endocoffeicus]MBL1116451.1 ABC transporter substrate-binding protein [Streptomyces endocoffeicus]